MIIDCNTDRNSNLAVVRYDYRTRDFVYYAINGIVLEPYRDSIILNDGTVTILNYTRDGIFDKGPYSCIDLTTYDYNNPNDCKYVYSIGEHAESYTHLVKTDHPIITITCPNDHDTVWIRVTSSFTANRNFTILHDHTYANSITVTDPDDYICITRTTDYTFYGYEAKWPGE